MRRFTPAVALVIWRVCLPTSCILIVAASAATRLFSRNSGCHALADACDMYRLCHGGAVTSCRRRCGTSRRGALREYPNNTAFVHEFTTNLLTTSFPNMRPQQVQVRYLTLTVDRSKA